MLQFTHYANMQCLLACLRLMILGGLSQASEA